MLQMLETRSGNRFFLLVALVLATTQSDLAVLAVMVRLELAVVADLAVRRRAELAVLAARAL